ncbi:MAG: energy transducer TonB [Flavobacteriales bacterium]|nr:energy transducer TonB [Flavobacteriales bacterium]
MKKQQNSPEQKFPFMNRFLVGMIVALGLSLTAFEWTTVTYDEIDSGDPISHYDDEVILDPLRFRIEEVKKPEFKEIKKTTEIKIVKKITKPTTEPAPTTEPTEPQIEIVDKGKYGMNPEIIDEEIPSTTAEFFAHYDNCSGLTSEELYQCSLRDIISRIQKNFEIPPTLKSEAGEMIAYITFVVNKKGEIDQIEVLKTNHPLMGKAAAKAVGKLPKMIPASQSGRTVSLRMNVPIKLFVEG